MNWRRLRRWVGVAIGVGGLIPVVAFAVGAIQTLGHQRQLDDSWRRQIAVLPAASAPAPASPAIGPRPVGGVDFEIQIPKLGYRAAVGEGTDATALSAGPGHYSGTAWPGQPGNVAVAAHNIFWIHFDQLRPGDELDLNTRWGVYRYQVSGIHIVSPSDRTVLVGTHDDRLTLTTCWPLWAGDLATRRLVVTAPQVSPPPAALSATPGPARADQGRALSGP